MTDIATRLEDAMTVELGAPVSVAWNYREFALRCRPRDGQAPSTEMTEAFDRMLDAEAARESTPGDTTPMGTHTLAETLDDLAATADAQGTRAAALDEVLVSSAMFHLADELRQHRADMRRQAVDDTYAAIDHARARIARTILALDRLHSAGEHA